MTAPSRIGCARVPAFALRLALGLPRVEGAVALIEEKGGHGVVREVSPEALEGGVRPGQAGSRARAVCPGLICASFDAQMLAEGARALARLLRTAAPAVAPLEGDVLGVLPGAWWFDPRGMERLGGERAVARRLRALAVQAGCPGLKVGIADTAAAARVAASFDQGDPIRIIAPGEDAAFLEGCPLERLALPEEILHTLRGLGLTTVEGLQTLPAGALLDRFGPAGRAALDRALGRPAGRPVGGAVGDPLAEDIDGGGHHRPLKATRFLEPPVERAEHLLFMLRSLCDVVGARLIQAGRVALKVSLSLMQADRQEITRTLPLTRPTADPHVLFELTRDRLRRTLAEAPIAELSLTITEHGAAVAEQMALGPAERWDPPGVEAALARLAGLLGPGAVVEATPVDDPRPEHAGRWAPVESVPPRLQSGPLQSGTLADAVRQSTAGQGIGGQAGGGQAGGGQNSGLPSKAPQAAMGQTNRPVHPFHGAGTQAVRRRLDPPRPLTARFDAESRPSALFWQGRWRRGRCHGPERLSGQWWSAQPYAREDWRMALEGGGVLWIGRDARTGQWWLLGWFE